MSKEEYLSQQVAADYLKINTGSLRGLASRGRIQAHKFKNRNFYKVEDVKNLKIYVDKHLKAKGWL